MPADERRAESDADVTDRKDALDVRIAHQRAELDRLQHRLDRVDTQAAAVMTGGTAFAALFATAVAAVDRHIDVLGAVVIGLGAVCVGGAVVLSLLSRDPRFARRGGAYVPQRWMLLLSRLGFRLGGSDAGVVYSQVMAPLVRATEQARATMEGYGVRNLPTPPDASSPDAVVRYLRDMMSHLRKLEEDRQVASYEPGLGSVELRERIASALGLRLVLLDELVESREGLTRAATVLLTAGFLVLAAALVVIAA